MDLTVCVGTYGDPDWIERAAVAARSCAGQAPVIQVHGKTLAHARNAAVLACDSEWIVTLDADDELEPGYVEALSGSSADLRAPSVRYVKEGRSQAPYVPRVAGHKHECTGECLVDGNWCVVGTMIRRDLLLEVGGWREFDCYEDWDLVLRCWQAGASVEAIPEAVYRAHVRRDSRNRAPSMEEKNAVHREIAAANGLGVAA